GSRSEGKRLAILSHCWRRWVKLQVRLSEEGFDGWVGEVDDDDGWFGEVDEDLMVADC
ncbi:hypothetical protein LINPERPRIM_LOCUS9269, partial [Linum perenne]